MNMETINKKMQDNHAEDLYERMPCGHKRRYMLGELCTVCEIIKMEKQLRVVVDRGLGNYDLD